MQKVLCVVGTRPELIKMAPVIKEVERYPDRFEPVVCLTGQHGDMVDELLNIFDVQPAYDLDVMAPNQHLSSLTALLFDRLDAVVRDARPDWVVAQGDTTSVFVASMVSYYNRSKFAHVEAGLRTYDRSQPFPEETNRLIADHVADLLFAPTELTRTNLLREGIPDERIRVTGNTVVDALYRALAVPYDWSCGPLAKIPRTNRLVLVTAHRRESFGGPLRNILCAVRRLADRFSRDTQFIYPVHPNPNVCQLVWEMLGGSPNITLTPPLDYLSLINVMKESALILTDSGGIQEEAPSVGVPVLILRNATERPEALSLGLSRLVGTDTQRIVDEATEYLLGGRANCGVLSNPYGDGRAACRIVSALQT
jgi:UDP-N-acetylglucosamine 2-epimerase (non-hydrolysing)